MNAMQELRTIYLTRRETAEHLRCTYRHTYRLEADGVLKPVKIGGLTRFRADDIRRLPPQEGQGG